MVRDAIVDRVWNVLTDTTGPTWLTPGFIAYTLDDERISSEDVATILDAFVESGLAQEAGGSYRAVGDRDAVTRCDVIAEKLQR